MLEDVQRLQHHRSLGPGRLAVDLVAHEAGLDRGFVLSPVGGQVLPLKNSADAVAAVDDHLGDLSFVEGVAGGLNARQPMAGSGVFGVNELSERGAQRALHQQRTGLWRLAVLVEYVHPSRRELLELTLARGRLETFDHVVVVRDAPLGVVDRRRENFGGGFRAVLFQQREQRVDHAGNRERHRGKRSGSGRYLLLALRSIPVDGRLLRRRALAA